MYTLETLKEYNPVFDSEHGITASDVKKANDFAAVIESTRNHTAPVDGDVVEWTTTHGDYYANAHIEHIEDGQASTCEKPYIPFVLTHGNSIAFNTSGGAWEALPVEKMIYKGTKKKTFCFFGSAGACAHGAVYFEANVSVWEYTEKVKYTSRQTGKAYTEREFKRMYISFSEIPSEMGYIYHGESHAWKNKTDLQAFLRTYRAEVFPGNWNNQIVAWLWNEVKHTNITPAEFEAIDGIEDTENCNGLRRCKRVYDENTHTVHTYYVWYWDEPDKDWRFSAMEQNKIRAELYDLDWRTNRLYDHAHRELATGIVKPLRLPI